MIQLVTSCCSRTQLRSGKEYSFEDLEKICNEYWDALKAARPITKMLWSNMNVVQLYNEWRIPFIRIGSGCLVSRENTTLLIERLYQDGYCFLGYDAFTVFANGSRQSHLEFSASYSANNQPTLSQAIESLIDDPSEISHYEFIFKPFT